MPKLRIKISTIYKLNLRVDLGFLEELWINQPNIVIGSGMTLLVLLGVYIQLLNIYQ